MICDGWNLLVIFVRIYIWSRLLRDTPFSDLFYRNTCNTAFYICFTKFSKQHLLRHSSRFSSPKSLIFSPWLFSESSMCDEQCLINDHQTKNPSLWYNANGRLGFSQRNRLRYFTTLQTYNSSLPPKRHVRLGHEADRKFSSRKASHFIE